MSLGWFRVWGLGFRVWGLGSASVDAHGARLSLQSHFRLRLTFHDFRRGCGIHAPWLFRVPSMPALATEMQEPKICVHHPLINLHRQQKPYALNPKYRFEPVVGPLRRLPHASEAITCMQRFVFEKFLRLKFRKDRDTFRF